MDAGIRDPHDAVLAVPSLIKAYTYSLKEAGLEAWPDGILRLDGTQPVESAKDADVFIYPAAVHGITPAQLRKLPYFTARPERHVFFHCADAQEYENLYHEPSIFIRCNTRTWTLRADPNTISWPWPVEDFADCIDSSQGFKFDVTFHGWRWSDARKNSLDSIKASGLAADLAEYGDFTGHIMATLEGQRRRQAYLDSMQASRIALCPESIKGVFPYRFFEAMSAGRVPLLVGSSYILPWADVIPWSSFILTCETENAYNAGQIAKEFLAKHSDCELIAMGLEARKWWESHLQSSKWTELMTKAVERAIAG